MDRTSTDLATRIRLMLDHPFETPGLFVSALDVMYMQAGRLVNVQVQEDGETVFVGGNDPDEVSIHADVGNLYVELERTSEGWRLTPAWYDEEEDVKERTVWMLSVIDEENAEYRASKVA